MVDTFYLICIAKPGNGHHHLLLFTAFEKKLKEEPVLQAFKPVDQLFVDSLLFTDVLWDVIHI